MKIALNFPVTRQGHVLKDNAPAVATDAKPSYHVTHNAQLQIKPSNGATAVRSLSPQTGFTVLQNEGGWALIGSEGRPLGYVATRDLVPRAKVEQAKVEPSVNTEPREAVATSNPVADSAIKALDEAIAANPNDANLFLRRGQILVNRGYLSFAVRDFDETLRLRSKDPEALNSRCWARAILGELVNALRDCNEALTIRPRYADALNSRGLVNLKIGKPNNAIADYDQALRLNGAASSLYGRGLAKLLTGNAVDGEWDIIAAKALQSNIADEFAKLGVPAEYP
jgi:tetratricopeptide (TPR) repeat protein